MKKLISLLLVVLLFSMATVPTAAAQEYDEPVRACTWQELARFLPQISMLFTEHGFITDGVTEENALQRLTEMEDLYIRFWSEIQPTFPDCAYALRAERLFARSFGEIYISLVWLSLGIPELIDAHVPMLDDLIPELIEFEQHTDAIESKLSTSKLDDSASY